VITKGGAISADGVTIEGGVMVVPTYLGAMQLGGMLGYSPLLMGPALTINGLADHSRYVSGMERSAISAIILWYVPLYMSRGDDLADKKLQ
jgi:hypothetical protein